MTNLLQSSLRLKNSGIRAQTNTKFSIVRGPKLHTLKSDKMSIDSEIIKISEELSLTKRLSFETSQKVIIKT